MTFWKTVGAVIVANIITAIVGSLLFAVMMNRAMSSLSSHPSSVDVPSGSGADEIERQADEAMRNLDDALEAANRAR